MAEEQVRFETEGKKGIIVTVLKDLDFFEMLLKKWAGYPDNEVAALMAAIEPWEITEEVMREEGFDILENRYFIQGKLITLIKVGDGKWIIENYSDSEMKAFVVRVNKFPS